MSAPDAATRYAVVIADLLALAPCAFGGVVVRAQPDLARDHWLAYFQSRLATAGPWRKLPAGADTERIVGGLDFAASLAAGQPVVATGLLGEADGGIVQIAMAERVPPATAAAIAGALDTGYVTYERHGAGGRHRSRFAVVACDEGLDDEGCDAGLVDRLAFVLTMDDVDAHALDQLRTAAAPQRGTAARFAALRLDDEQSQELCAMAVAFGIRSVRGERFAALAARGLAALAGRDRVSPDDIMQAAAIVLAPRATRLPAEIDEDPVSDTAPAEREHQDTTAHNGDRLEDRLVEATRTHLPAGLLAQVTAAARRHRAGAAGSGGAPRVRRRGRRPLRSERVERVAGRRIDIPATLRAAAPMQALRGRDRASGAPIIVRRDDLHAWRFKDRDEVTVIFVVDASGSQALQRMGEVKGAIETLLADSYVRRDQVALVVFRGDDASLLLPPTRALARARRLLSGVPAGGGTPLAAAIASSHALADAERRQGRTPLVVLLTDGRANIALDGAQGAPRAHDDAVMSARGLRTAGIESIVVDTARRPRKAVAELANELGGRYVALPRLDSPALLATVNEGRMACNA